MNIFPAALGTVLRQFDEDGSYNTFPIIGWLHITGTMAQPILTVGNQPITSNSVLETPVDDGVMFSHPSSGRCWFGQNEDEMIDFVGQFMAEHPVPGLKTEKSGPAKTDKSEPQPGPDTRPLHFGNQSYKTRSFWHWPDANAVFEIEGEQVYPSDPRAVKVKREEKTGDRPGRGRGREPAEAR